MKYAALQLRETVIVLTKLVNSVMERTLDEGYEQRVPVNEVVQVEVVSVN